VRTIYHPDHITRGDRILTRARSFGCDRPGFNNLAFVVAIKRLVSLLRSFHGKLPFLKAKHSLRLQKSLNRHVPASRRIHFRTQPGVQPDAGLNRLARLAVEPRRISIRHYAPQAECSRPGQGNNRTADGKDTLTRLVSQRSMPFQKIPQTPGGSRQSPVIW
jgi:hypothetical protein